MSTSLVTHEEPRATIASPPTRTNRTPASRNSPRMRGESGASSSTLDLQVQPQRALVFAEALRRGELQVLAQEGEVDAALALLPVAARVLLEPAPLLVGHPQAVIRLVHRRHPTQG